MHHKWIRGIAIIMGIILSACKAPAGSNGPSPILQSQTVVVATKATDRSSFQTQQAVLHSATPTTKPSAGVQPCDTAYLAGNAVSDDASGAITFSVQITNQGPATCKLQGWPQIQIVDQQGEPLVLQDIPFCFECSPTENPAATPTPGEQTAQPPVTSATAQAILQKPVSLPNGKSARLFLIWRNWCPPFPNDGVNLILSLSGGSGWLTIPTDARSGGSCGAPTAGSTLEISQFMP
jgi:hypothetical protein